LWSIGILVMLVLAAGMLALIFPNVIWTQHVIHVDSTYLVESAYLPQLFFGLICLIVLFNIYLIGQKVSLNHTRRTLISELVLNERLESLSLVDPLTQLLNRRALSELVTREVARANRLGGHLTFMTMDLNGFREINSKFGAMEGNLLLVEFSKMLKATFRGGDMIFRQGGDEFLVIMPDTAEEEAQAPLRRLLRAVEQWNASNGKRYELSFTWATAPYVTGSDVADVLRAVDRKIYQKKHNLVPVF
jgi:diguanylate cyclase (GGDEF)-like protein